MAKRKPIGGQLGLGFGMSKPRASARKPKTAAKRTPTRPARGSALVQVSGYCAGPYTRSYPARRARAGAPKTSTPAKASKPKKTNTKTNKPSKKRKAYVKEVYSYRGWTVRERGYYTNNPMSVMHGKWAKDYVVQQGDRATDILDSKQEAIKAARYGANERRAAQLGGKGRSYTVVDAQNNPLPGPVVYTIDWYTELDTIHPKVWFSSTKGGKQYRSKMATIAAFDRRLSPGGKVEGPFGR